MADPNNPNKPLPKVDLSKLIPQAKPQAPKEEPAPKASQAVDMSGELTEEEKAEIVAKAREQAAAERREANKKAFFKNALRDARKEGLPGEEMKQVVIDVAGHADRIIIDGQHFFHGALYTVPKKQYDTINEIMSRTWDHEYEVGGANRDVYRQPMNRTVRPGDEGKLGPVVKF